MKRCEIRILKLWQLKILDTFFLHLYYFFLSYTWMTRWFCVLFSHSLIFLYTCIIFYYIFSNVISEFLDIKIMISFHAFFSDRWHKAKMKMFFFLHKFLFFICFHFISTWLVYIIFFIPILMIPTLVLLSLFGE